MPLMSNVRPLPHIVSLPSKLLFLPGASGNTGFWLPVAGRLTHGATHTHIGWPGFGPTPAESGVSGIEGLVSRVLAEVDQPTALIAQSMGGVVAAMAALERPNLITHLVLTVTSGGINTAGLGAQDWRPEFLAAYPLLPPWFADFRTDLTSRLGSIQAPTLLLWGDADPISPVAVGERLAMLLPNAKLHVLSGGAHDLAHTLAVHVAPLIDAHLAKAA
jgi:pimeloyl-ACP methyl ester carboxylesterase